MDVGSFPKRLDRIGMTIGSRMGGECTQQNMFCALGTPAIYCWQAPLADVYAFSDRKAVLATLRREDAKLSTVCKLYTPSTNNLTHHAQLSAAPT